jgi:hypothetical protein
MLLWVVAGLIALYLVFTLLFDNPFKKPWAPEPNFTPEPLDPINHPD